jgi:hypothetical protein
VIAAFVFAAVGTYYLAALKNPTPTVSVMLTVADERVTSDGVLPIAPDPPPGVRQPPASPENRSVVVITAMSESVIRDPHVQALVNTGLAQSDAERIVDEFAHGIATCLFENARKDYETRGYTRDEFTRGAELIWASGGTFDLKRLPPSVAPCVTNVGQQAGLAEAVGFEPRQRRPGAPTDVPASTSAPNPDETEAAIHSHIAKYPDLAVTDLFVHCEARGCEILMRGEKLQVFELEFDRFAEENGFLHAVVLGDESFRTVWLQR